MDQLKIGDAASFTKTIGEHDVYAFAGITGDFHPNHVDACYAAKTRFGTRVAHGALTIGYISTAAARLTAKLPAPGCAAYRFDVKLVAPIAFGDTVTFSVTVLRKEPEKRRVVLKVDCTNQDGKTVALGEHVLYLFE